MSLDKALISLRDKQAWLLLISMLCAEDKMAGWRCAARLGRSRPIIPSIFLLFFGFKGNDFGASRDYFCHQNECKWVTRQVLQGAHTSTSTWLSLVSLFDVLRTSTMRLKQSSNCIFSPGVDQLNQQPSAPNGPQESFCGQSSLMPVKDLHSITSIRLSHVVTGCSPAGICG